MLQTHHVSDEETLILRFPSSFNSLTENNIIEEEIETRLSTQNHRWDLFLDNRKKRTYGTHDFHTYFTYV